MKSEGKSSKKCDGGDEGPEEFDAKKRSSTFENLIHDLVKKIFAGGDAVVGDLKRTKDGGWDIEVTQERGGVVYRVFFECKLKGKENLGLRTIAANAVIAFNKGAMSFVAVTNYDIAKQAADELLEFSEKTPVRVKLILGEDINPYLIKRYAIKAKDYAEVLDKCGPKETTAEQDVRSALLIDFKQIDFPEFLFSPHYRETPRDDAFIEHILKNQGAAIRDAVDGGESICVIAPQATDIMRFVRAALDTASCRIIEIDASTCQTAQDSLSLVLRKMWGLPSQAASVMLYDDLGAVFDEVDNDLISQDYKRILCGAFSGSLGLKDASSINCAATRYIVSLAQMRTTCFKDVFVFDGIKGERSDGEEFLIYLALQLIDAGVPCIVNAAWKSRGDGGGIGDRFESCVASSVFISYPQGGDTEDARKYIRSRWSWASDSRAVRIVRQTGGNIDLIDQVCKGIEALAQQQGRSPCIIADNLLLENSSEDVVELTTAMPALWNRLKLDRVIYAAMLVEWRLTPALLEELGAPVQQVRSSGLFREDGGIFTLPDPAMRGVYKKAFEQAPPSDAAEITSMVKSALESECAQSGKTPMATRGALLRIYCKTANTQKALEMADELIPDILGHGELSYASTLLPFVIEAAERSRDGEREIRYRILHLRVLLARKRVWSSEYKTALEDLQGRRALLGAYDLETKLALALFKAKRAMREQDYDVESAPIEGLKKYYSRCVSGELTDNPHDLLGSICSQYALVEKRQGGNQPALAAYRKAWKMLHGRSLELKRGYLSHLACMSLSDKPLRAKWCYGRIINMLEEQSRHVSLPLHEYCDEAMAMLLAANDNEGYEEACDAAGAAAERCDSHGAIEEAGRAYNIQGCANILMGRREGAISCLRSAIALLGKAGYVEYAWRSELNLAVILSSGNKASCREAMELAANAFEHYKKTQGQRLNNLIDSLPLDQLRRTREYVALLSFAQCAKRTKSPCESNAEIISNLSINDAAVAQRIADDMNDFCGRRKLSFGTTYVRNGKRAFHIA